MYAKESKAIGILKKYFTNTELAKELSLYNSILKASNLAESKAEMLINTICDQSKKLNREKLEKEKYNLIKEIKKNYNLDDFFKAKIKDYKISAAVYTVLEAANLNTVSDTEQLFSNKEIILEHITENPINKLPEDDGVKEFIQEDKDVKILTYKFLVEKFNDKYSSLSVEQKDLLKEYINNVSDTVKLKEYLNVKLTEVKKTLTSLHSKINNKVTAIKLQEVVKNIETIPARQNIKDDHLISLMQYYELVKEIKNTLTK